MYDIRVEHICGMISIRVTPVRDLTPESSNGAQTDAADKTVQVSLSYVVPHGQDYCFYHKIRVRENALATCGAAQKISGTRACAPSTEQAPRHQKNRVNVFLRRTQN